LVQAENRDTLYLDSLLKIKDEKIRTELLFSFFDENYQFSQSKAEAHLLIPYALKMLEKSAQPFSIAKSHQSLAYIYSRARDYSQSAKYAHKALDYWQSAAYGPGIAEMTFHLAYLKMNNGDEGTITPDCHRALGIARKANSPSSASQIASWLGGYFLRIGQYDSARFYFEEGIRFSDNPKRRAFNLFDIANCHLMKKEYDLARKGYENCLQLAKDRQLYILSGAILSSLAYLSLLEKKYNESAMYSLEAMPLLKKYGRPDFVRDGYATLMDIHEATKDYKKALEYAKFYQQYTDSANIYTNQNEYRELEEKYQVTLKDKLLAEKDQKLKVEEDRRNLLIISSILMMLVLILGFGIFVINRRRKESLLREKMNNSEIKALRAQMNPHFMFNSLNAIQQMVLNGENEEAFRYLNTYSKLTRQILENSEKKWISVKDEIRFLDLYLKIESLRFDHAFSYQIEISDEVMPNKDLVPAMVIQPIVENAIKHGLMPRPGDKKLEVRFGRKEEGNMLEIQVEDNGVGRFAGSSEKKESDHKSMSLGITANRLQLLDATGKSKMDVTDLKDESGNSAGTLVKITISQPES
jgi:tetratricopeptide (TPR) repeat protein